MPDAREVVFRQSISNLLARANQGIALLRQQMLSPRPLDLTRTVLENQVLIMRSLAFVMDEVLVSGGAKPEIQVQLRESGDNGQVEVPAG